MNPQLASQINQAIQYFRNGNLSSAEELLIRILKGQPRNLDALHILGSIYVQQNKLDDAEKQLKKALKIYPNHPGANYELALVFSMRREPRKAIPYHQKSIKFDPNNTLCHLNYGVSLAQLKEFNLAIVSFNKAIALNQNLVEAWSNLGGSLKEINKLSDSLDAFEKALSINPNYAQVWANRGNTLHALKRYDEALASYDKALNINPNYAEAWSNRGIILHALNRYDESLASYDKALNITPNYAEAWSNKGITLHALKRFGEALALYKKSLSVNPDNLDAHWNESHTRLVLGEFPIGWEKYEYRWKRNERQKYRYPRIPRLMDLNNINDKRILIWSEQGFGDTIQFSRYIPMLTSLGAQVIFEVQAPLLGLMRTIPNCEVISQEEPFARVDLQSPLLSLPLIFKTVLETIPPANSYLRARAQKVAQWGKTLNITKERINVGIACSGNVAQKNDISRPIKLELFKPLSEFANLFLIQKDIRDADRDYLKQHAEIKFVGDQLNDFEDTAALVENMDLIISVDTSLVHLAGSLGKPFFVLLSWNPDWRWLLDRNDSPWYPTARLFRQPDIGNWTSVIQDVIEVVKSFQK